MSKKKPHRCCVCKARCRGDRKVVRVVSGWGANIKRQILILCTYCELRDGV